MVRTVAKKPNPTSRKSKAKRKGASVPKTPNPVIPQPSPDREWFARRFKECGYSQNGLARALALSPTTLTFMLAGSRRITTGELVAIARLLKVSLATLVHKLGFEHETSIPLRGRVLADGRVSSVAGRGHGLPRGDYPLEVEALRIAADQGPLLPYDGGHVVYLPGDGVDPQAVGRLCIVEDATQTMPRLAVLGAFGASGYSTTVFGTNIEVRCPDVVRVSRVLGLHMP